MKKSIFLLLLVISTTTTFAKVARHNFQMNFGGGYQSVFRPQITEFDFTGGFFPTIVSKLPSYFGHGGVASVELGYVLHSVRESGIIHGLNVMVNISTSFFPNISVGDGGLQRSLRFNAGGSIFYTVGRQLKSGRLMFDILGFGSYYGIVSTENKNNSLSSALTGSHQSSSITSILPGVQYIMNNGFTVGWRNQAIITTLDEKLEGIQFSISTVLSIGFTFGGGTQPWERKTETTPAL